MNAVNDNAKKYDKEMKRRFVSINKGMSKADVKRIMSANPDSQFNDLWIYKLSIYADNQYEKNWKLFVCYENDIVVFRYFVYNDMQTIEPNYE